MKVSSFVTRIITSQINLEFPESTTQGQGQNIRYGVNIVDRIIKVLRTGMQWTELEVDKGSPKTIYCCLFTQ